MRNIWLEPEQKKELLCVCILICLTWEGILVDGQRGVAGAAGAGNGVRAPVGWHESGWGMTDQVALARRVGVESVSVRDLIVLERHDRKLSRRTLGR